LGLWAELEKAVSLKQDSEFVLNKSAPLWQSFHCATALSSGVEGFKAWVEAWRSLIILYDINETSSGTLHQIPCPSFKRTTKC